MICKKCGQTIDDSALFCGYCGEKVTQGEQDSEYQDRDYQDSEYQDKDYQGVVFQKEILQEDTLLDENEDIYTLKNMKFKKESIILLVISTLSVFISFIPLGTVVIIIGMVLGLAGIIGASVMLTNGGNKAAYLAVLFVGIGGLLLNLGWGYYIWILL